MKTNFHPKKQKTLFLFLVFFTGLACIIALQVNKKFSTSSQVAEKKEISETSENSPILVSIEEIKEKSFSDELKWITGKIDVARSKLGFELTGVVSAVGADKGDYVHKGDLLAELDKTDLLLKEKYKINGLEGAQIELEKATAVLEENQEKAKSGMMLGNKLKEYELDVKLKQNKVAAQQLEIDSAQDNIKKAQLRAPFDGVILERNIEIGENLSNNKTAFIILDINNIYADLEINEKKLSKIQPGQEIKLKTNVFPDTFKGSINAIVPAVQGKAMILSARAKIEKTELSLLPGMFVMGDIVVFKQDNAMVIPIKALSKENNETFVFLYNEKKNIAIKQTVETGYIGQNEVVIKSGLKTGQKIIIESSSPLKDSVAVKVEN
ncbi:MAG: putative HlyD family secretion protein [uncultured bacterium]|nr:MAG: putative HlyD family secretion protein [uncultured bacterium]